ncbi:MAG TPA: hypothetical protein VFY14_13575 [Streptomyces sp.]|nr:hypothetical protein [Streptomyces sp.]
MPGHSPAGPTPPFNVVQLHRHRREPTIDHDTPGDRDGDRDPRAALTETVQAFFTYRGQSLADPATAAAFDTTCEVVLTMLEGAFVQGHLGNEEYQRLRSMLQAARNAPGLL